MSKWRSHSSNGLEQLPSLLANTRSCCWNRGMSSNSTNPKLWLSSYSFLVVEIFYLNLNRFRPSKTLWTLTSKPFLKVKHGIFSLKRSRDLWRLSRNLKIQLRLTCSKEKSSACSTHCKEGHLIIRPHTFKLALQVRHQGMQTLRPKMHNQLINSHSLIILLAKVSSPEQLFRLTTSSSWRKIYSNSKI